MRSAITKVLGLRSSVDDALIAAVIANDRYRVRWALVNKANPNTLNNDGFSVLFEASKNDQEEIVSILLKAGASVDFINYHGGTTPLHAAAKYNRLNICRILLDAGAKINSPSIGPFLEELGYTALHFAAEAGHIEMMKLLIERKADINAGDSTDDTPLHLAIKNDQLEAANLLVSIGANVDRLNCGGSKPLHEATHMTVLSPDLICMLAFLSKTPNVGTHMVAAYTPDVLLANRARRAAASENVDLINQCREALKHGENFRKIQLLKCDPTSRLSLASGMNNDVLMIISEFTIGGSIAERISAERRAAASGKATSQCVIL